MRWAPLACARRGPGGAGEAAPGHFPDGGAGLHAGGGPRAVPGVRGRRARRRRRQGRRHVRPLPRCICFVVSTCLTQPPTRTTTTTTST